MSDEIQARERRLCCHQSFRLVIAGQIDMQALKGNKLYALLWSARGWREDFLQAIGIAAVASYKRLGFVKTAMNPPRHAEVSCIATGRGCTLVKKSTVATQGSMVTVRVG
jgi:hypothetical protein